MAAVLAATAAPGAAHAQSIAQTAPDDPHRRGSLGMPFPGVVFDVEVLGPNRFVLAVEEGETERVQIFTAMGGFEGAPFSPQGFNDAIEDVVAVPGGYWVVVTDGATGALTLRRFDASGRPRGEAVQVPGSSRTAEARLFPLAGGGVLAVWSQERQVSGEAYPAELGLPRRLETAMLAVAVGPDGTASETVALDPFTGFDKQQFLTGTVLPDGSVVVGWAEEIGSGGFGSRLAFTQFGPDGSRLGHPVQVWSPSPRRPYGRFLNLVPVRGEAGFAAVFSFGVDMVIQRFDADGVALTGVEAMYFDGGANDPLYVSGREVLAVGGAYGLNGVFRLGADKATLHQTDHVATAHAVEADGSVVAAYQTLSGDVDFTYLYRVVME